jgi:prefoldin subunit 5
MIGKFIGSIAFAAALILGALAQAQETAAEPTLAERIATLERQVASLDTRFAAQSTLDNDDDADRGVTLTNRVDALERSLERMISDLHRLERQSESALRAAEQAQRDATTAQQLARDAASRPR